MQELITSPVDGRIYWIQFYQDKEKKMPYGFLWLIFWNGGGNEFGICTFPAGNSKPYIQDKCNFTGSLRSWTWSLFIPTETEIQWYNDCKEQNSLILPIYASPIILQPLIHN